MAQVFASKVEAQLVDYDDFAARSVANAGYEKIVNTMLDTLQHMAKMDRSDVAGEDKGQLNHSIIMIGEHVDMPDCKGCPLTLQ